jgi:NAD(P)-dependent dehydrogenase (short-subunit alcohol dehydrogenase family)
MEETIKRFGTIDVLVNNATISRQSIASQSYEMSAAAATNTNINASTNYQDEGQALFLASEASSYVTGTMIYSDGGLSLRDSR